MSDSSYIQALIDRGPGVVRLKAEHYVITDQIVLPEGVSLVGDGPGATQLDYVGTGTAILLRCFDKKPTDYHRHHGRLSSFTLCSVTGRDGVAVKNCGCITLDSLRVVGFQLAGLHLATLPGEAIMGINATACEFDANGIGVLATGANDCTNTITFTGCRIRGNHSYNVRIAVGFESWTFTGCNLEGLLGHRQPQPYPEPPAAVFAQYGKGLTFSGCYYEPGLQDPAVTAMQLGTFENHSEPEVLIEALSVTGCEFHGYPGQTAIRIGNSQATKPTGVRGGLIAGNRFGGFKTAIDIQDGENLHIGGNSEPR